MTTITRQRAKRIREQGREFRPQLVREQHNRCWWCSCLIVEASEIHSDCVISVTHDDITFINTYGDCVSARIATADHLIPVSEGGRSVADNLVAACKPCNEARQNLPIGYCRDCGKPKERGVKKRCLACREANQYHYDCLNRTIT